MSIYPGDMDADCIPLCDALNALPGICTVESCCGHGIDTHRIFFTVVLVEHLSPILRSIESSAWRCEVFWTNGQGIAMFMLKGPIGQASMPGGANDLASWIRNDNGDGERPSPPGDRP
jgi:tRNA(Phe) wybutosine-synthesizing methylase Tyw3